MNRGDIHPVAGGVYASKPRPALIVQDDLFGATQSVTVIPFTTTLVDAPLMRVRVAASELSGLEIASDAMIDKLTTVRRSSVGDRIGRLSSAQMLEVERALATFLGLAG